MLQSQARKAIPTFIHGLGFLVSSGGAGGAGKGGGSWIGSGVTVAGSLSGEGSFVITKSSLGDLLSSGQI